MKEHNQIKCKSQAYNVKGWWEAGNQHARALLRVEAPCPTMILLNVNSNHPYLYRKVQNKSRAYHRRPPTIRNRASVIVRKHVATNVLCLFRPGTCLLKGRGSTKWSVRAFCVNCRTLTNIPFPGQTQEGRQSAYKEKIRTASYNIRVPVLQPRTISHG